MARPPSWRILITLWAAFGAVVWIDWSLHADREIEVQGIWHGAAVPKPPKPDENALGRPEFKDFRTVTRGTGFLLDWKDRPYLVSCFHVFGSSVHEVTLKRGAVPLAGAVSRLPVSGRMVSIASRDARADVSVFPASALFYPSRHFRLAAGPPVIGQRVWLFFMRWGENGGQEPFRGLLTGGMVTRSTNRALVFRYDSPPDITMTSGAPILDENGEVVGINTALFMEGEAGYGLAAPHEALRRALEEHGLDRR